MTEFPTSLLPALARVVEEAKDSYPPWSKLEDFSAEYVSVARNVQAALRRVGYELSILDAYGLWELYSLNSQANWLMGGDSVDDALIAVASLCQDVADGQDYIGISRPAD